GDRVGGDDRAQEIGEAGSGTRGVGAGQSVAKARRGFERKREQVEQQRSQQRSGDRGGEQQGGEQDQRAGGEAAGARSLRRRGDGAQDRPGRGRALPARGSSPPGGDRQGHPPFRLHDGNRARRGFHQRRHGRGDGRAGADSGGGDADPVDARGSGRDDLRQPQQVYRQRHQIVRSRRLQALRQGRAGDREAARAGAPAGRL